MTPDHSYPLTHVMPNGSNAIDWLGTASTAAKVASIFIERVRNESGMDPRGALDHAESDLLQALEELRTVRAEVER